MSDTPQGDGWWEASDGRWYPPEAVPGPGPEPSATQPDPGLTQQWDRSSDPSGPGSFQAPSPSPFEPPSPGPAGPGPAGPGVGGPSPGYGAPGGPPPSYGTPSGPPPGYGTPPPGQAFPGAPGSGIPPAGPPPGFGPPGVQAPGYGGPPGPPKNSSRTAWIVLAVIGVLLVLSCGGCLALAAIGANDAAQNSGIEVLSELTLDFDAGVPATGPTSCEVTGIQNDGSNDYAVDALVTNASGVSSHYRVDYDLLGPNGDFLGSDFGIVSGVQPDESVRDSTIGVIDGTPAWQDVTCTVIQALRIPAE